jgi:hypothetical protein
MRMGIIGSVKVGRALGIAHCHACPRGGHLAGYGARPSPNAQHSFGPPPGVRGADPFFPPKMTNRLFEEEVRS